MPTLSEMPSIHNRKRSWESSLDEHRHKRSRQDSSFILSHVKRPLETNEIERDTPQQTHKKIKTMEMDFEDSTPISNALIPINSCNNFISVNIPPIAPRKIDLWPIMTPTVTDYVGRGQMILWKPHVLGSAENVNTDDEMEE